MEDFDLVIIKLGGSVITYKDKPLSPNYEAIERITDVIKEVKKSFKVIIVHGGGSFGHYWSVIYDIHTKPCRYSDEGISVVHESMIKLNHIIIEKFISNELKPYSIPPSSFVFNNSPCKDRILDIVNSIKYNDIIPITYGDVIHTSDGNFSILSGDTIMTILSNYLNPKFSIFTTNVDGLYENIEKGHVLSEINLNSYDDTVEFGTANSKIKFSDISFDVTGGMKRKINESVNIARKGIPVYLINGFHPERILDIIGNRDFIGTCIQINRKKNNIGVQ